MLFLQYTLLGLILGGVYGIAASGLVLTYTTSGIFNFAHGAIAMLSAYTYWQFRVGWHWSAPLALFVVLGVMAPLLGAHARRRDHAGAAQHLRDHQDHGDDRADDRRGAAGQLDLEPADPAPVGLLLRQRQLGRHLRQPGDLPRVLRARLRRGDRARAAIPLHPQLHRRRHARRRRRSGPAAAQRRQAAAAGDVVLGARRVLGCARRDPHHADPRGLTRPEPADAAGHRRVRGSGLRTAAQRSAHVRRRHHHRPGGQLRRGLSRQHARWSRISASRCR